jgi:putative salt-induced outer membrane protein YdiY
VRLTLRTLLALICISGCARADVVNLKNGDRVTGTLVTVKGGKLTLKSDVMGQVTIPLAQVARFSTAKPVAVVIKGQRPMQGSLEIKPSGEWQVAAEGKNRAVAPVKVDVVMPTETYQALVEATPEPWQGWKGSASLGYSIQHGNQQTNTLTTTINAVRERPEAPVFQPHWRTNFGLTTLLSHAQEQQNTVTSHTLSTSLRQDYLLTPSNFVFALAQFDHVSTEGLYLRQTYGGGFGRDLFKGSRTTLSALGGLTFVHQKFFTGECTQSAEALAGEKLGLQIMKWVRFDQYLNFYPNISYGGEYRFDTSGVLSVKLSTRLSLNTSVIDLYLSNPPAGNQKNNITLSTGIGYTF